MLDLVHRELAATFDLPFPSSLTFEQRLELLIQRQVEVAERRWTRGALPAFNRACHGARLRESSGA